MSKTGQTRLRWTGVMPAQTTVNKGTRLIFTPYRGPGEGSYCFQQARYGQEVKVISFEGSVRSCRIWVRFGDGYETESSWPMSSFTKPAKKRRRRKRK